MQTLSRLFGSPARVKMLRLFIFNPEASFSVEDIEDRTKIPRETVRSELVDLRASGLLRKKTAGGSLRYQVNPKFEHLEALDTFVRDTTNVQPKNILAMLKKAGTLRVVALSGLFIGISEPQVDLIVVGDNVNERALAKAVHALEADLGREIRYAYFPTADFRYRLGVYDRLIRDVFDYPHRLLVDKIGL